MVLGSLGTCGARTFRPKNEAKALQARLKKDNVELFIAAPGAGDDITTQVFTAIKSSQAFIAFGTKDYAEDTGNAACTYRELAYWQNRMEKKVPGKLIPINMLHDSTDFEEIQADVSAAPIRLPL